VARDGFVFNTEEFSKVLPRRRVILDNESMLDAPAETFDDCFQREPDLKDAGKTRFSTVGRIVEQELRGKSK
jgi:hypothetical protein